MNYYYGMDNFEKAESLKTGNSLKFQRRMVHSDESITLKINNNIDKNNK